MRINGLYKVNFKPGEGFKPERVEYDHELILPEDTLEFMPVEETWEERVAKYDITTSVEKNIKEFKFLWKKNSSKEDKLFTGTELAKQARLVKAGDYYYQFLGDNLIIDVSRHYQFLLERYGIFTKAYKDTKVYFWKKEGVDRSDGSIYYCTYADKLEEGTFPYPLRYILASI